MRFDIDESLGSVRDQLSWIEARLQSDPTASDLAPGISELLVRVAALQSEEGELQRAAIRADAEIDAADGELDDLVEGLAGALRQNFSDPDGAHFRRYFSTSARQVVRLGLASQLAVVRGWPALLAEDGEPAVVAGAEPVSRAIARGDAAIAARRDAVVRAATYRVDRKIPLYEDAGAVVTGIADALAERSRGKPEGWVTRFLFKPR